jgi:hypothetical protein
MVSESTLTGKFDCAPAGCGTCVAAGRVVAGFENPLVPTGLASKMPETFTADCDGDGDGDGDFVAGLAKRLSSSGTFASIFS